MTLPAWFDIDVKTVDRATPENGSVLYRAYSDKMRQAGQKVVPSFVTSFRAMIRCRTAFDDGVRTGYVGSLGDTHLLDADQ